MELKYKFHTCGGWPVPVHEPVPTRNFFTGTDIHIEND